MLTSIVILTFNKLENTQLCIESIRKYTSPDQYEIIVVDNNSTDGTREWLKSQQELELKCIFNNCNNGFPKGCNQGIEISNGDNILLLNNDTIVTTNWLDNLLICLYSSGDIGAVGAITNNCSYYQSIPVNYQTLDEMQNFATINNVSKPEQWEERLKLIGFCMLIKREVIDKIGLLDEIFSPGNFEDDDYSLRIRKAGYKLELCKDTFIHHFGSTSFKENYVEYINLLKGNEQKFEQKWGFNPNYSTFVRHEIVNLIDDPKEKEINVLEVGCACGGTLLKIKSIYKNAKLSGIELNEKAAEVAKLIAEVKDENVEESTLNYAEGFFDYVIFADVLEHLVNPWDVLKNIKKYLKKDGQILASIPNVMHYSVLRDLINGHWQYSDAGILDRTHLRFFTLHEFQKMLVEAGYKNITIGATTLPKTNLDEDFIRSLNSLNNGQLLDQYNAYQYIVKAKAIGELDELLIQIEKNDDVENNIDKLNNFDIEEVISTIENNLNNKMALLNIAAVKNFEKKLYENVLPYLLKAYELDNYDQDTLYNLGFVLNFFGEKDLALVYLNKITTKDESVISIIEDINKNVS